MTENEALNAIHNWQESAFPKEVIPKLKPKSVVMVGNWISTESNEEWYGNCYICSFCQGEMIGTSNYCPWCGKDMGVEDGKT